MPDHVTNCEGDDEDGYPWDCDRGYPLELEGDDDDDEDED